MKALLAKLLFSFLMDKGSQTAVFRIVVSHGNPFFFQLLIQT